MSEPCIWCGTEIDPDEGYRAYEPAGERRAAFCRLEHVVPWVIRGDRWEAGEMDEPEAAEQLTRCAHCDAELGDVHVVAVSHRGKHRIADGFCGVDHLGEWAKAGGRWQVES